MAKQRNMTQRNRMGISKMSGIREELAQDIFSMSYDKLDSIIQMQINTEILKNSSSLIEAKIKGKFKDILIEAKTTDMTLNTMDSLSKSLFS